MNILDMRTILFSYLISNAVCAVVMASLWFQNRRRSTGLGFWLADFIMQFLALLMIDLRGIIPDSISILIGSPLSIGGTYLLYMGLERYAGKKSSQIHNYLLLVVYIFAHVYFAFLQPSLLARNVNFSLALLVICFQCAWLMLRGVNEEMRPETRMVGVIFGIFSLMSLARALAYFSTSPGTDLFASGLPDTLALLVYQMLFIGLTFGLFLMVNRRLFEALECDIIARQLAEEALRESKEKFSLAFQTSPYAITITHAEDRRILEVNDTFFSITGFTREEVAGATSEALNLWVNDEDRLRVIDNLSMGRKVVGEEFLFRKKSGEIISGLFSADVIVLQNERFILSSISDITARKRAEEEKERLQTQLLQAQKMESVGTLAGGVAHDFNNLLQAISGYTSLILWDKKPKDSEYSNLKAIEKAVERAAQLVKQLLLFSRKVEVQRRPVDINQEVGHARGMLERTIPKMIDIEVHLASRLWTVKADPVQIEQVLLNLGSNGADAMPDGGRLSIKTENITLSEDYPGNHLGATPGNYVLLTISDTGHGIEQETIRHIFDPFFTTKEIGKGTGLGLASVYGIVKGHQGYITCDSEVGQGTTFKIYLPAIEQEKATADSSSEPQSPKGGKEVILLADDEASIRNLASLALQRSGYTVITVPTGEEALEIFITRKDQIDLIILDIGMPGMGGHRCLREILQIDQSAKIIIASGYAVNGQMKESMKAGVAGYVGKPYQLNDLLNKVRAVLDGNQQ
ncbi:MAG: response regulator [Deltaproteobacteria bacterium]|nr:response regulator [Deltaproteobacteria bacterium]